MQEAPPPQPPAQVQVQVQEAPQPVVQVQAQAQAQAQVQEAPQPVVQVQEAPQPPVQVQEAPPPQPRSWLEGIVNKVYTEEENAAIDRALSQERDGQDFIVEHFTIILRSKDMTTLQPRTWLNDNIIDFYMKTLSEREKKGNRKSYFFSTKFYTKMMRVGYAYEGSG